ncbi:MAG: hypothetical protein IMZ66_09615 [Planctomycetes bacterium]|nr:hypothetical protein [Planctomycetota bacterium]
MTGSACRLLIGCVVLAAIGAAARGAPADKATEVFESLYGADVKRVRATRDGKDDVELATRLLAAAREVSNQPEFLAVLCETACDLAAAYPDGYGKAIDAMELLALEVPAKAAECAARVIEVRQKQFDAARGDDRADPGEALIQALLGLADLKAEAGAPADAAALCRRADKTARAIKSDRLDEIEARQKALVNALRIAREADGLKAQLEKDPQDAQARAKLVALYLVDADNPAEAAKYVDGVADTSLRRLVPAAAKGVEAAPELACRELGEWYRGLADGTAAAKPAMLGRAREYYERFLELHPQEDLDRTAVVLLVKRIDESLAKLDDATAGAARRRTPALPKRIEFVAKLSMAPFKTGRRFGPFPAQQTDDATGPFAKKGVFFDNKTGKDVVYAVTWPDRIRTLYYKGGAVFGLTIEIQDLKGKTLMKAGPYEGGNKWHEYPLNVPPSVGPRFILKVHNTAAAWFYIDTIEFR